VSTNKKLEIEVKIKIENTNTIKQKLLANKFILLRNKTFEYNILFDTPQRNLKKSNLLLRLRTQENETILTFKKPPEKIHSNINYKVKEEIEVMVSNFEEMKAILMGLGFELVFIYEKYREVFKKGRVQVMIDTTPIGSFLEIEGTAQDIDKTATVLGYKKEDYIKDNYLVLYKKASKSNESKYMQF
jgi:predicted adenylyl cyclase CyaB